MYGAESYALLNNPWHLSHNVRYYHPYILTTRNRDSPDSKVQGANMGPIWDRQDPGGPHAGPVNLLSGSGCHNILQDLSHVQQCKQSVFKIINNPISFDIR